MAHKTANRRSLLKTILTSHYIVHPSKAGKKLKRNTIFRFLNKEEDEDNDQTFWPFTSKGRLSFSRLS
jgi:hypothetical protein